MDTLETHLPDQGTHQRYELIKDMGDCYAQLGEYNQAQQCYRQAASLAPDEAAPYVGSGVVALQQGRLDEAELAFRVALRLDSENSKAWAGLAMIRQQTGALNEAFDAYLNSLQYDCDNLTALLGLFQVSCQMGTFDRVIDYLKRYLERHPADTAVMFSLAALYLREGQYFQAERMLQDILILEPANQDAQHLLEETRHQLAQTKGNKNDGR